MKPIAATFWFVLSTLCILQQQVVVVVAAVAAVAVAANTDVNVKLIEEACQHSPHKDLCISTLKNDPNSMGADLTGLAYVAIRVAAANATSIEQHLRSVMVNSNGMSSLHPAVQQGFADCAQHYSDANEMLDDSTATLSRKAYDDVQKWVNVAIGDADFCDASLHGQKTQMTSKNQGFRQLCDNVLSIIKVLAAHN